MGTDMETIQIALAFCDPHGTYSRHAAVTMASIYSNTESKVCIHILHDETLSDKNRELLTKTAEMYSQEVEFHNLENMLDEDKIDVSKLTLDGAKGTLFRFMLPELLDVPKVIYMDCDIVVTLDIKEMWDADMDGCAIAAVPDYWTIEYNKKGIVPKRLALAWKSMGISLSEYFNAGVIVMNLDKIRHSYDFLNEIAEFYSKFKKAITLADQDCLNYIFAGDCKLIDEKFNKIITYDVDKKQVTGYVWHMAGGAKPWQGYTRPYIDDLYWYYLKKTPYYTDEAAFIRTILTDVSSSKYMHNHSSDCVKRIKSQMADNIFRAHIWTIPHILIAFLKQKRLHYKR